MKVWTCAALWTSYERERLERGVGPTVFSLPSVLRIHRSRDAGSRSKSHFDAVDSK